MKVLINTPNYKKPEVGGVANHYYGLKRYWTEKIRYNIVGNRGGKIGSGKYWLIFDIFKFTSKIILFNPDLIVLNPSLGKNALKRDAVFLYISKLFKRNVTVFFHGFSPFYAKSINVDSFRRKYKKTDSFIVLSSAIKKQLENWGFDCPIYLSTTKVSDDLIKSHQPLRSGEIKNILFLGRIEKEKGIFLALDIFYLISKKYKDICFTVVGAGNDTKAAKEYCVENKISNIAFLGSLSGDELVDAYIDADLYLFTSFHEGMPTTVLEAMAFGLPIITRPVGGLVDFFDVDKMGALINSYDAKDFIDAIEYFMLNPAITASVSQYNAEYAKNNFMASKVAPELELIFSKNNK